MDRRLTVAFCFVFHMAVIGCGNSITNLSQCVGQVIDSEVLSRMPSLDNSTPEHAVLGFIKGALTGNYRAHLFPLLDELRLESAGVADLAMLQPAQTDEFFREVNSMGFTNHVLLACNVTTSNTTKHVVTRMRSVKGMMQKDSAVRYTLVSTNGEWRISFWDVDE